MNAALLLVWNDVLESRRREYDCWHTLEHVPERVSVEGFRQATRYALTGGAGPSYLTAYELDDLSCLQSPKYGTLVEQPTPWTASMRPAFRNFTRRTYDRAAVEGDTVGGAAWVRRMVLASEADAAFDVACAITLATALAQDGAMHGVTRVQIGHHRPSGPQAMPDADAAPVGEEWVVVLECAGPIDTQRTSALLSSAATPLTHACRWSQEASYALLTSIRRADLPSPHRRVPRSDLMNLDWS